MFGLFKKKPKNTTINVTASINAKLMPIQRGEVFSDPMDAWLKENSLGFTEDGGCGLTLEHEIDFCDIELELYEVNTEILDRVVVKLENIGAPKGSKLRWDDQVRPFGRLEGLAIYLQRADLRPGVYDNFDPIDLCDKITTALNNRGFFAGHWNGRRETGIYLYGPSYDEMRDLISEILTREPVCEKCRVVQIAPRPEGDEI